MRYRSDGVEGVLDGEQQNLVATVGVVSISGPGDPLGRGVVKVGLLA